MNLKKEDLTLTETSIDCFRFDDVAFYHISKELTQKYLSENRLIPRDDTGNENDDFASGEIQIFFNRDQKTFSEALIALVYESDGSSVSGDVYGIDDLSEDIVNMAMEDLYPKGNKT